MNTRTATSQCCSLKVDVEALFTFNKSLCKCYGTQETLQARKGSLGIRLKV